MPKKFHCRHREREYPWDNAVHEAETPNAAAMLEMSRFLREQAHDLEGVDAIELAKLTKPGKWSILITHGEGYEHEISVEVRELTEDEAMLHST